MDKIGIYREGLLQNFWKVLSEDVKAQKEKEYAKLRKCKRDSAFYKTQGYLDALDWLLSHPQETVAEHDIDNKSE